MIHRLVSLPVHEAAPPDYVRVVEQSAGFRHTTLGELPPPWSDAPPVVCFEWIGARNTHGYPQVRVNGVKPPVLVHRLAHVVWNGPIPEEWEVDHLCGNVDCWRPEHLQAVTKAEHRRRTTRRLKVKRMLARTLRTEQETKDGQEFTVLVLGDDLGYAQKVARARGLGRRTAGREGRQIR